MSAACYEARFAPPTTEDEQEDDESVIVGCLKGICVQIIGSEEQYSLDFTTINLLGNTCLASIQLGKKWVDSIVGSNSPSPHTHEDGRIEASHHSFESFFDDKPN